MFKAILLDFGGVIYQHPKAVIPEVIARIYDLSLEVATKEYSKYKHDYYIGKLPTDKLITSLSTTFKSDKSVEEIKKLWLKHYSDLAKPNTEVLDIIRKLHQNYKIYLFSNTTQISNLHNSKTGIYDYFDDVFMSYRMGMKKPNQKMYQQIISTVGFRPQECIFIDDDPKNLEPAKQMGITPILFNVLTDSPSKLEEGLRKLKVII